MTNATDFMGAVYDKLANLLGITDTNPSVVMQMAWPGFSLSAQDFRRADQPAGPYDPQVARETFSHLANIAPVLNRAFFQSSGMEVEDLYEILVSGAIPAAGTPDTIGSNPIYKLFSDAQFELLQARTGSVGDPNAFYFPCTASPANWYDDAAAAYWPTVTLRSTDIKPSTPSSPFVKVGGLNLLKQGLWRVKPSSAASASSVKLKAQQAIVKLQKPPVAVAHAPPTLMPRPLSTLVASAAGITPLPSPASGAPAAHATVALTSAFAANLATVRLQTLFTQKIVATSSFNRYGLGNQLQALDLAQKKPNLGRMEVANRFQLISLINQQLPTKPPGTSDGFSISFRYCRVNIDRSWFKLALLRMKNWYMCGTPAGEYSNGSSADNPGMFPLLPTSFIAIRDLKITANWSQDDRVNLDEATAMGFFDVRDGTLNSNTLEVKGLQILGWISTLMPELPPMSSP